MSEAELRRKVRRLEAERDRNDLLIESLREERADLDRRLSGTLGRVTELEARLQMAESKGQVLYSAVQRVVNDPTSSRSDAQGILLVAAERYDGRRNT